MKKFYRLEYQETEKTFADMHELYFNDKSYYFYRLIVRFVGILLLCMRLTMGLSTLSLAFFVKFFLLWALAYVAGYFLVSKVLVKMNARSAQQVGKEKYQMRTEKCGTDLKMTLDFHSENFTVTFQNEKKEYSYKEITRMLESDEFYGFVLGGVYGEKQMIGFPAEAICPEDKEAFHVDLAEKCTNVAGGFKNPKR